MNKLKQNLIIILIPILIIIGTNKTLSIYKQTDPIMKKIINNKSKFEIKEINAKINNNFIEPGVNGKKINIDKTYNNMKKYGSYNETKIELENTKPTISIYNNYDKYIKYESNINNKIGLIIIINDNKNISKVINTLVKENIKITVFINPKYIDSHKYIFNKNNIEVEIYTEEYNKLEFTSNINYLESKTNNKLLYCYTKEENDKLLNICKNNKLNTVIPNIIIDKELYRNIKNNLEYLKLITIVPNNEINKELLTTIKYIKSKNYEILKLNEIVNESI